MLAGKFCHRLGAEVNIPKRPLTRTGRCREEIQYVTLFIGIKCTRNESRLEVTEQQADSNSVERWLVDSVSVHMAAVSIFCAWI